jgi:hypothetical protein
MHTLFTQLNDAQSAGPVQGAPAIPVVQAPFTQ